MMKKTLRFLALGLTISGTSTAMANERYCREYTQQINIGGKTQKSVGKACLQDDGSWRIISNNGLQGQMEKLDSEEYVLVERNRKRTKPTRIIFSDIISPRYRHRFKNKNRYKHSRKHKSHSKYKHNRHYGWR